ncbi:lytic transglycosylase domain-containing protein [Sulfitobacter sp. F26169L]|uniref:lytic transglycosylase domain-containing protein n=1 Tax=Sulfitobacter sp. F26169L TaxID=2996015 RepID=UPI00226101A0|nr:lytic transglycosylase domain-containing protein [Sulfitobacter sp. F26169L]MCX7565776.1 lytic transglycosylase domain-containing protein [Sulfitobacter sp. F26169L]
MQTNWLGLIALALFSNAGILLADNDPAQVCDTASRQVAKESGVPLAVLRAITRTETGRGTGGSLRPWPWTVNMEGKGVWFDSEDEARVYVFRHFKNGARSFDVGCFQINYRWHGKAFNSIEDMFDPLINTRYAAKFLGQLYGELGDWTQAAGAYHSRTRKYATRYMARYEKIRSRLSDTPEKPAQPPEILQAATQPAEPNVNTYSLLTGGSGGFLGSLMPATSAGRSLFARQSGG